MHVTLNAHHLSLYAIYQGLTILYLFKVYHCEKDSNITDTLCDYATVIPLLSAIS